VIRGRNGHQTVRIAPYCNLRQFAAESRRSAKFDYKDKPTAPADSPNRHLTVTSPWLVHAVDLIGLGEVSKKELT